MNCEILVSNSYDINFLPRTVKAGGKFSPPPRILRLMNDGCQHDIINKTERFRKQSCSYK